MFSINATLVLQIGHFWIAYYILKKILLEPVISIIEQEQKAQAEWTDRTQKLAQNLGTLEEEKRQLWRDAYASFATHIPRTVQGEKQTIPSLSIIQYTPAQQEAFEQSLTAAIIRKASHG